MPKNPKDEAAVPAAGPPTDSVDKGGKKERPAKGRDGKDAPKGKGKGKTAPTPGEKKGGKPVPDNPNFRYIVRIGGADLDGRRSAALALTGVRGVGLRIAEAACHLSHVDPNEMIGNLPEATVDGIETTLTQLPQNVPSWMVNHPREYAQGETLHYIGPELETGRRDDINLMKMIRSYRGVRHERGQKVRGQRTRSNGRTGMAAGVIKKTAREAAAAGRAKEEGGGG
ncbi:MAG: 30S ribosomal protein S13, partial [Thermoplasmata archaeon]